ncbi:MAG: PspC domain-containing protein [Saprospiraceae bacterium]
MNKILNINLGGYAITIDDDAYEYLSNYIESIRKRFSESEGRDEIVHDIETRLGELITQSMGTRTIVMLPDVEAAIEVMGKPEDFGDPAEESSSTGSSAGSSSSSTGKAKSSIRTGKRLFRDEEDAVVGGVCSGLSAYFGMHDPVWMRLIFVLLTFLSAGFWIPAYILLWILVPQARTAADRLSMRGEPINVDNIAREIEDSFDRLSTKVNEYGAQKKSAAGKDRSFGSALSHGVAVLGQMFGFVIRFIVKFGVFIAALVAIALFVALAVSWVAGIWGLMAAAPFVDYFSPYSGGLTWLGFTNLFFLLGIPVLGLCLVFARAVFKTRTPGWLSGALGLIWILNLICAVFLVGFAAKGYRQGGTDERVLDLSGLTSDTLRVEAMQARNISGRSYWWFDEDDDLRIDDNMLEFRGFVEIRVNKSETGAFKCTRIIRARGSTTSDAIRNAESTEFPVSMQGNVLKVPSSLGILKGQKWRGQHVRINIEVPVGKSIVFDEKIYRYAGAEMDVYADDNDRQYISRRPEKVFRMTGRGLICAECPRFGDRDYRGDEYYEHFILEGNIEAEIRRGNDFKFTDPSGSIQKIQTGDKLTLINNSAAGNSPVKVFIEAPAISSLYADNTGEIVLRGFEENEASISAKGKSRIKAYIDVDRGLTVTLSGQSSLELVGEGNYLDAGLSEGARLEALGWRAERVEITASEQSDARVYAKQDALVISDGSSSVKVEGGATVRNTRYEK